MKGSGRDGRKTKRIVRTPATKFAHLAKRLKKKGPEKGTTRDQK